MSADEGIGIRDFAELRAEPWRNGGGITRTVAAADRTEPGAIADWRISVADIEADGAFSAFPGVDRIFTLIEGTSVALTIDGVEHVLPPRRLLAFDGSARTTCRISGPTRDLNVMVRRGAAQAAVSIVRPDRLVVESDRSTSWFAIVLAGSLRVSSTSQGPAGRSGDRPDRVVDRLGCLSLRGRAGCELTGLGAPAATALVRIEHLPAAQASAG